MTSDGGDMIELLDNIEVVRRRPRMFWGDLGAVDAVQVLVAFLVRDVIEAFRAGSATRLDAVLAADGTISLRDDGPGVVLEGRLGHGALTGLFSTLHAGGEGAPQGYGWTVVNAVCVVFEVDIFREGRHVRLRYARGRPVGEPLELGPASVHGTMVTFAADPELVRHAMPRFEALVETLRVASALAPGLVVEVHDDEARWLQLGPARGLVDLVAGSEQVVGFRVDGGAGSFEVALCWDFGAAVEARFRLFVRRMAVPSDEDISPTIFAAIAVAVLPDWSADDRCLPAVSKALAVGIDAAIHVAEISWCPVGPTFEETLAIELPKAFARHPAVVAALRARLERVRDRTRTSGETW